MGRATGKAPLTEGAIGKTLIKLTLQMMVGILGMASFSLVDTLFVGQLGKDELTAMSFTFPVVMIFMGLSLGLGTGTSAVISRFIGAGDREQVRRLTTDSLLLAVLIVGLLVIVGLLTMDPLFSLLGASEKIRKLISTYMFIWYAGVPFVVVPMVGNSAIRATGDAKTPSLIMLTAFVVNLVLDPLLIFGVGPFPRLELAGAALATLLARATALVFSLWVLSVREKMLTFTRIKLAVLWKSWKQILYVGLPNAGSHIILPIGSAIITRILATHSLEAVAAFGAASRIDRFVLTPIIAMTSILIPFIGQNCGAGRQDRMLKAVKFAQRFALYWGLAMLILFSLISTPLSTIFNDDPLVRATIAVYFCLIPFGYGPHGVLVLSNATFNALNRPLHATSLNLLQIFVFYIPLASLGSWLFGVPGVFLAAVAARTLTGTTAFLWLKRVLLREKELGLTCPQVDPVLHEKGLARASSEID